MDPKRAQVTELVRRFFDEMTNATRAGTLELWHKVEQRRSQQSPPPDAKPNSPAPTQQPVQQQQSRIGPDET